MAKGQGTTSGFRSVPSSRLGRVAGWLLFAGHVLAVLNSVAICSSWSS